MPPRDTTLTKTSTTGTETTTTVTDTSGTTTTTVTDTSTDITTVTTVNPTTNTITTSVTDPQGVTTESTETGASSTASGTPSEGATSNTATTQRIITDAATTVWNNLPDSSKVAEALTISTLAAHMTTVARSAADSISSTVTPAVTQSTVNDIINNVENNDGMSTEAKAAIGATLTALFVAGSLAAGYFWSKNRRQDANVAEDTPVTFPMEDNPLYVEAPQNGAKGTTGSTVVEEKKEKAVVYDTNNDDGAYAKPQDNLKTPSAVYSVPTRKPDTTAGSQETTLIEKEQGKTNTYEEAVTLNPAYQTTTPVYEDPDKKPSTYDNATNRGTKDYEIGGEEHNPTEGEEAMETVRKKNYYSLAEDGTPLDEGKPNEGLKSTEGAPLANTSLHRSK